MCVCVCVCVCKKYFCLLIKPASCLYVCLDNKANTAFKLCSKFEAMKSFYLAPQESLLRRLHETETHFLKP